MASGDMTQGDMTQGDMTQGDMTQTPGYAPIANRLDPWQNPPIKPETPS